MLRNEFDQIKIQIIVTSLNHVKMFICVLLPFIDLYIGYGYSITPVEGKEGGSEAWGREG